MFMVICVNGVFSQRGCVGTSAHSTQPNRTWASATWAKFDSGQIFDLGEQKFHANIRWVLVVFVCSFLGGSAWALGFRFQGRGVQKCLGVFWVFGFKDVRFHPMLNSGHFGAPSFSRCF